MRPGQTQQPGGPLLVQRFWPPELARAGVAEQRPGSWRLLLDKLNAGLPLTLLAFGSSIVEGHAGCFADSAQTLAQAGVASVPPGMNRTLDETGRCVRFGWASELLAAVNATWPHPQHLLVNAGRSAANLQSFASYICIDPVYCVPVTLVDLSGEHAVLLAGGATDVTPLRAGILMPRYACTLSNVPQPMDASWALRVLSRMSASLRAVHAAGWVHGDVKPSNIFLDFAGDAWLGDYGSSRRMSDVASYTGGTPAFQCADVSVEEPARFDRACLAVTMCSAMGVLEPKRAPTVGWPAASLHGALAELAEAPLKAALEELLFGPPEGT